MPASPLHIGAANGRAVINTAITDFRPARVPRSGWVSIGPSSQGLQCAAERHRFPLVMPALALRPDGEPRNGVAICAQDGLDRLIANGRSIAVVGLLVVP